jgi:undecaprenyl-diphosphatase
MDGLQAALLGFVQGLTEFLPVSSSGHLVMAEYLLGLGGDGILFEVVVHVGTLLAVLVFYHRKILMLIRGVLSGGEDSWRYVGKLAVATLPGVVAAFTVRSFLESLFDRPAVVGVALLFTGALLWTTRVTIPRAHGEEPGWGQALAIGCVQVVAIVPGISRSGATVAAALALGVAPVAAAEFSFLMSVAAIAGAAVIQLPEAQAAGEHGRSMLLIGGGVASLSGIGALWLFIRMLRNQHFHRFAWYTWTAGAAFLAWLAF